MEAVRTNEHPLAEHRLGGTDAALIEVRAYDPDGAPQALGNTAIIINNVHIVFWRGMALTPLLYKIS